MSQRTDETTLRDILVSAFERHSKLDLQNSEWLIEWTSEPSTKQPVICLKVEREDKEITLLGRLSYGSFTKVHRFFLKEQTESAVVYVTELMLDHLVFEAISQESETEEEPVAAVAYTAPVQPVEEVPVAIETTNADELLGELEALHGAVEETPKEEVVVKKGKNKQVKEEVAVVTKSETLKEALEVTEATYADDKLSVAYEFALNQPVWLKGFIRNNQGKDHVYDGSEWLFFSDLGEHSGLGTDIDISDDLGLSPGVYDIQIRTDKDANASTTAGELVSRSFQFTVA